MIRIQGLSAGMVSVLFALQSAFTAFATAQDEPAVESERAAPATEPAPRGVAERRAERSRSKHSHSHSHGVKFDKLSGKIERSRGEWLLRVKYQVDVRRAALAETGPLTLVVDVMDGDRTILLPDNKPLQIVVPLERAKDDDDEKLEFEGRRIVSLGTRFVGDIGNIQLYGSVVAGTEGEPLARKHDDADLRVHHDTVIVVTSHHVICD